MPVSGKGKRKVLIIAEAPGATEDEQNRQLCGKTGQYLERELAKLGMDMRRDCWLTNSVICRTSKDNRTPTPEEITYCRPTVIRTIGELKPETIILLGAVAVQSVIGWLWEDSPGGIGRWVGMKIPSTKLNCWIYPCWHPSYVVRNDYGASGGDRAKGNEVREMVYAHHLKRAFANEGRPFDVVPDYESMVRTYADPDEAVGPLRTMLHKAMENDAPLAYDYETDRLKPDHPDARIICCSVSDGETSIAFPMHGEVKYEMEEWLISPNKKLGWNAKFEHRWSRKVLGVTVKGWVWDGMLAAHVLDGRPQITGLKFQAFATLGVGSYNDEVGPYMKAKDGNSRNRLHELPIEKVLSYCAKDSLYEWHVSMKQMEVMSG